MMENSKPDDKKERRKSPLENINGQVFEKYKEVLKRLPDIGPVLMLYMQSGHRKFNFISDLEWLLLPPLMLKQCKLYTEKGFPISYISWAFLNETVEKRLIKNCGRLSPEDWESGSRLWLIDVVAPFGGVERMLADIRFNLFPDRPVRILARDPATGGVHLRELPIPAKKEAD
ncbi:MAG: toxin-activating lysine-acyltransferase [Deltaproteobacteria bacterium]|nr:MAG: toxin-activating lysine-acyltransferase [Deltaproteobacteria bacterium]